MTAALRYSEIEVDEPQTDAQADHARKSGQGKIRLLVNDESRIGALRFIRRREPHHERAAIKFKDDYERAYGGQAGAIDLTNPVVDNCQPFDDGAMVRGLDRVTEYRIAKGSISRSDLVIACVCNGQSIRDMAGGNSRFRSQLTEEILMALDDLAVHYGFKSRSR